MTGQAPTSAADRHPFEADDSGISCVHCGLPWPHDRHRVRVYHPFRSGPASWLICADDGIMVGDKMTHERWHQEMTAFVGSGGTLAEPTAASLGDSGSPS